MSESKHEKTLKNGQILKIESINNMGVFDNFNWPISIPSNNDKSNPKSNHCSCENKKDATNNASHEFGKINIFYGQNYSGKTTLSRIFRALEEGSLPENYNDEPKFKLLLRNKSALTHDTLTDHGVNVRVFNEDFVKDNLGFINDEKEDIKSFAILGDKNTKLEKELKRYEEELDEAKKEEESSKEAMGKAKEKYNEQKKELNSFLSSKAKSIKEKFKRTGYNIISLTKDIKSINETSKEEFNLSQEYITNYENVRIEVEKDEIKKPDKLNFEDYCAPIKQAKQLVEQKISLSEPIEELIKNSELNNWVHDGLSHHKDSKTCAFCSNDLTSERFATLEKHFNKESEKLRDDIKKLRKSIENKITNTPNPIKINEASFYLEYKKEFNKIKEEYESTLKAHKQNMNNLIEQLDNRENDIFHTKQFEEQTSVTDKLKDIYTKYCRTCDDSNNYTEEHKTKQEEAERKLILNSVHDTFFKEDNNNYNNMNKKIDELKQTDEGAKASHSKADDAMKGIEKEIDKINKSFLNEEKAAGIINGYLNHHFAHKDLSIKAIKSTTENAENDTSKEYRFEVYRNKRRAYNLSTGERNLIAFCYFVAKLKDNKKEDAIIWIDDPVSSLDDNHTFFIYSLIEDEIVDKAKQLFISTHNFNFLKYLDSLPCSNQSKYFRIDREERSSNITFMLHKNPIEFSFLFKQIYKCSSEGTAENDNTTLHYTFGNNVRKFLEIFLLYKYPDEKINFRDKLHKLFGNEDSLVNRVIYRMQNDGSHVSCLPNKDISTDPNKNQQVADLILKKIEENDEQQYKSLLNSIGVKSLNKKSAQKSRGTTSKHDKNPVQCTLL